MATIEEHVAILGHIQTVRATNTDRRALVVRAEAIQRALFGYSHTWIADLMAQHGLDEIWGSVPEALSRLLRVSTKRAGQRVRFAEQFGERTAITGQRLEPVLPATTRAAEDGSLDEEHQMIIKNFFGSLGSKVDIETRENAETQLAQLARELLPDEFRAAAKRLFDTLDPDGSLKDEEQIAAQCYLRLGKQGEDGLTKGNFVVDAELAAYLQAAFDKWAKPGMCNPADHAPAVDDPTADTDDTDTDDTDTSDSDTVATDPALFDVENADESATTDDTASIAADDPDSADAERDSVTDTDAERRASRDTRSQGRRQHDALKVILRQMLASGQLGTHRGLPVTAVITMTLQDLEAATGHAVTATGSLVRMRDAIRMASHAHHYLTIFDDVGRPLHLGRSKRLASADQRIVLIASDRGCTFPGCTRPATWSQVHHVDEWTDGGNTDIEKLTFGCDMHHRLVGPAATQWATTKAGPDHPYPGRTLWHPPVTLDPRRRGLVNHFHHPNEYIHPTPQTPPPSAHTSDNGEPRAGDDPPGERTPGTSPP